MALVIKRNVKPKAVPGLKRKGYKKAGAKYGPRTYVLKKGPATPKPAPGPYDRYKGTPYEGYFERQDAEAKAHQDYLSGTLMPQVSAGLAAITGVNPASPGYNPTIQQQYLANIQGSVGNALNASAAATPMTPGSSSPGGIVAAPNAYQGAAMQQYAAQRGGAAILNAQAQAAMNTTQPNIYAQAAYSKLADYAAGLPKVYADRKAEDMLKVNQYLAEAEETARHNRVSEAISAQNAQTNAAIQFGRLGLDTSKLGQSTVSDQAKLAEDARQADLSAQNRIDVANIRASSSGSSGSSGPSAAKGQYAPNKLRKEGFVGGWRVKPKKPPAGAKGGFTQATDGTWWIKPGKPGGPSTATVKPKDALTLGDDLRKRYKPGDDGGWEEAANGDPQKAAAQVAYWVRVNKPSFIKAGRKVDTAKLDKVLSDVLGHGTVFKKVRDILRRGYITSDGRWK